MFYINQVSGRKINQKKLLEFFKKTSKIMKWKMSEIDISLAIIDDSAIKRLNKTYRGQNKPTDVLSFNYDKGLNGEIIISYNQAKKQAQEFKHSILEEIKILTVHGFLHLAGYDHKTPKEKEKMNKKECKILGKGLCGRS